MRGSALIIILLVLGVIGFSIYLSKPKNFQPAPQTAPIVNPTPGFKTYTSKFMKFSIQVPSDFQVEEKFTSLEISSKDGLIMLDRISTNFDNIDSYLNELARLNHLKITDRQKISINNLSSEIAMLDSEEDYFIYTTKYEIFAFSTSSPELYSDLDQIARSFKYNP